MKLYIKNKIMSIRGSSSVCTEDQKPAFLVKGKFFTVTRKKIIMNLEKEKLYIVRNKYWHMFLRSTFIYDAKKNKVMTVKNNLSMKTIYDIETNDGNEWTIEGNILSWNYNIMRNGEIVGTIKRNLTIWVDGFELECVNDEDAPLLVALVIAIDNLTDRE